ncbi:DExH-box ATP-dependent RNA helicase DExH6 isoform X1 [Syzygium oleosum]|uniref:DExH-box ATP-dependent RNA helicase DExH6 isoform X1 n=2 Tax=Syzygium oleosum TaxID=219896 RepID=UPI0024BACC7F|nr:DExH-box ATP-dependent RNA helicase DExH6 isoform X1 [Syzygium oleosum]
MGKKRQRKGEQQQKQQQQQPKNKPNRKVAELTRIRIAERLDKFRASKQQVLTFDENLSNHERAVVHAVCRKMGMTSKSSGHGNQRHVSVYKSKGKGENSEGKGSMSYLTLSQEAKEILNDLFIRYPPGEGVISEQIAVKHTGKSVQRKERQRDDIFCRPPMDKADITKKVESLSARLEKAANLKQITEERSKLPIASFRDVITSSIDCHQVVLISGETGCGKTTQVPQFLLDSMWAKGEACKIVCTQPRRISATSVAERISSERGENVGDDIGYKIRLESKGGKHSSIVFCTNGVLLRVLVSRGAGGSNGEASNRHLKHRLSDITHIIVDEIHERDRFSDFILAILRDMLPLYPHLRLILMSATLDAERFSHYFGGCPIIRVPGFTYPVRSFYLEDALTMLKSVQDNHLDSATFGVTDENQMLTEEDKVALDDAINLAWSSDDFDTLLDLVSSEGTPQIYNYQHSLTGMTPLMVFTGKGRAGDVCMLLSFGADCHLKAKDGATALDWAERENQQEAAELIRKQMESTSSNSVDEQLLLDKYLSTVNPELIDVVLIEQLLKKICTDSKDGAILVFLPGWDDINRAKSRLLMSPFFKDTSKFVILPLHSMVPSMEQRKVFKRPPVGCRKIILSTNIAETAITIDDVVYVIDSGRMKEKSYDPYNNVSTLQSSWISKASAKQREGRAGRCQPGTCYHLYSKLRAASLPDFQVPEIRRMPIEELCLQVKLLNPNGNLEDFLLKTLDPPVSETIRNAVNILKDIGALSLDEKLTDLGEKLGSLPVHPLTSKMLLFAILMNCLDPALTLACASDYRDPFTLPMLPNEKKRSAEAKAELASLYNGQSDQLAVVAAFECWKKAKDMGQEARFCSQFFVSSSTMRMLSGMRKQLQMELTRNGFIPEDVSSCSLNAHDPGIIHAVLVAGLYPMVGRLVPRHRSGKRFVETANGDRARLHPHSINYKLSFLKTDDQPLFMYDEVTRGDGGTLIRNCTVVGPLPVLLLGTEIAVAPGNSDDDDDDGDDGESDYDEDSDENPTNNNDKSQGGDGEQTMSCPDAPVTVVVDRWLPFGSTALDIARIYCLREQLSAAILFKVIHPHEVLPPVLGAYVYATACILSYDGLSGILSPSGPADSLMSMVNADESDEFVPERRKTGEFLRFLMRPDRHHNSTYGSWEAGLSLSTEKQNYNDLSIQNIQQPFSPVSTSVQAKPLSEVSTSVGYGPRGQKPGFSASRKKQNTASRDKQKYSDLPIQNIQQPFSSATTSVQGKPPSEVSTVVRHGPKGPKAGISASWKKRNTNGLSIQNIQRPFSSASTSGHEKPPTKVSTSVGHGSRGPKAGVSVSKKKHENKGLSNQNSQQPSTSDSMSGHPKPPAKVSTLVGYGSNMYGPYGPRGDSLKRQRGNGSG